MAEIDVRHLGGESFEVTIDEHSSQSVHIVTASAKHVELLCEGCEPEHLVAASMRFLLDREPKEAIMNQFDLDVIATYFPDYVSALPEYL